MYINQIPIEDEFQVNDSSMYFFLVILTLLIKKHVSALPIITNSPRLSIFISNVSQQNAQ